MITFEILTEFSTALFNGLYGQCEEITDADYPWENWPHITTPDDRRAHIREAYDRLLTTGTVWLVSDDGKPVCLNAGQMVGGAFVWHLGLVGRNNAGSKSWMYDPTYTDARNAMWDTLGIDGWTIEIGSASAPVRAHVLNKRDTSDVGGEVDASSDKGVTITRA